MKNLKLTIFAFFLCFQLNATIIAPFENLGDLTMASDEIIIATVTQDLFVLRDKMDNYSWKLNIQKSFKGNLNPTDDIVIDAYGGASTRVLHKVIGDYKLEVGKTYLIFLNELDNNQWKPYSLAYYMYEEVTLKGRSYWVPTWDAMGSCTTKDSKPLFALDFERVPLALDAFIGSDYQFEWKDEAVDANVPLEDFYHQLKAAPAHCVFFFNGSSCGSSGIVEGVRWINFPGTALEFHHDIPVQVDKPNAFTLANMGIGILAANYMGTNLLDVGSVMSGYSPDCTDMDAVSNDDFVPHSSGINGGRNVYTIWDDPCSQITDLVSCGGTLAIGGLYASCATNSHDGFNWFTAQNGYVVVNNGTGGCQSDADFTIMLEHEYTHALGFGHIAAASGVANMNPTCCNAITALDMACVDYVYPPAGAAPVTWLSFEAEERSTFNNLVWATASEVNNDRFEIEHSSNGIDFEAIGTIDGQGNQVATTRYEFQDFVNLGASAYYRIKQIDFNGEFSYSNIVSVRRENSEKALMLFPNPAQDQLNIIADLDGADITVVDGMGRIQTMRLNKHSENNASIDLTNLAQGVYYLQLGSKEDFQVRTFVKN